MSDEACNHVAPQDWTRDLALVAVVILVILVLREFWCWLSKTNHLLSELRGLRADLRAAKQTAAAARTWL